jgi:hypothetical protein
MSGLGLWNPNTEEGPNMSGQSLWNLVRGANMSGVTGIFGGRIDF